MGAAMTVPADAAAVLKRACRDCHSNDTTWPWYSGVAPVSWLVIDHVRSGRRHFNYSEWTRYESEKARKILHDICEETRDGSMPIGSYLLAHREARLSEADVRPVQLDAIRRRGAAPRKLQLRAGGLGRPSIPPEFESRVCELLAAAGPAHEDPAARVG